MDWVDLGRKCVPARARYALQRFVSLTDVKLRYRARINPLATVQGSEENRIGSPLRFGIVRNPSQYHTHYVSACLEMGVPFRVLDFFRDDWLKQVQQAACGVYLIWPDATITVWADLLKDRVEILNRELAIPIVPSLAELWFYEDKRRTIDWMRANEIPHPRTWILYDRSEAEAFIEQCEMPIVFKSSFGGASAGVRVLRRRSQLRKLVRQSFHEGFLPNGHDRRDRQWGFALLQEYLPDVKEWRIVRVGHAYFCRLKERRGDFHSGSGRVSWAHPPIRLLDLARSITDQFGFRSMDVDVFETLDGRLLINELQTVFGAIRDVNLERRVEHMGRWEFDAAASDWSFEQGFFYQNACANERIRDAIARWPEGFSTQREAVTTILRVTLSGSAGAGL